MSGQQGGLQSVQATMLIPLWGRSHLSRLYPDVLNDLEAIRIVDGSAYDFSAIERAYGEYGGLSCVMRARLIDRRVRAYSERYPQGSVVNIGAGLDTTFSRVDNGVMRWYNLDLPSAIAYRQTLVAPRARSVDLARSMFDYTWMDELPVQGDERVLLIAGGVFWYFEKAQVRELIQRMVARIPHGELFFDAASPFGMQFANRKVRKSGNKDAQMHFSLSGPSELEAWSPHIHTAEFQTFWGSMKRDARWHLSTRITMYLCDFGRFAGFYCIRWG